MRNTAKVEVSITYLDGEIDVIRAECLTEDENTLRLKTSERKEEIIPLVNVRKYSTYNLTNPNEGMRFCQASPEKTE